MSKIDGELIQWKKLYQLVSGTFYNENQDVIKKKLLGVQKEIQDGLSTFNKPSTDANAKLEKMLKDKKQEKLIPFTQKLYQFLDLDVTQSYDILCYYLVNEYRGSASSLQNFMSSESLMIKLLSDIWFYYSLERMVLLKVTKCIIEYHNSDEHPYADAFKTVLDQIGFGSLRKSYIDQFEALVKDIQQTKLLLGDIFNNPQKAQLWSERKHREINEVLQIIIMTCHFDRIKPAELKKLVELFKLHSFGKHNQFLSPTNEYHNELVRKVTYNEIALLTVALSTTNLESIGWMEEIVNELDEQLSSMHHYPEHGPILMSWMLFKFASKSNETTTDHYGTYGKLGSRAVQLNVFDFLHKMLTHRMLKDESLVSKIITRCIYDNLSFLCELFNADGSMQNHPKIFELFSEVLKSPIIARDFCKSEENPIRTLFNSAVEKFPFEFIPLSLIAKSLASASKLSCKWILDLVQNLEIYTEQPNDPIYELRKINSNDSDDDDAYELVIDYQPYKKIDNFMIAAGTRAVVREVKGRMFVHFITKLNYFNALHNEINEMMSSIMNYSEIRESRVQRLEAGISFLAATIKRIDDPSGITNEMIHPTEMVFDILSKFKTMQEPSLDLMAKCLDVCAELIGSFGDEIFRRFINLHIAPSVNVIHQDFRSYANGIGYKSGLVGFYLINIERVSGRYSFLKSYLNFLKSYTKLSMDNIYSVELPGLLFLLREIFVHAHSWHFENEQDKMDIFSFVFEYFHDILTLSSEVVKVDPARKLLRNVCIYSLLHLDNGIPLLRYVAVGNPSLQGYMENESNWFVAADSNLNQLVLNAMKILMQILRLKATINDGIELTPLEQLIYTQPKQRDALKIIPIVTNYTNYPFNRRFPILSCRLLRRFAIEFQRSLSACLDMEPDQIRMTFLQKLRDRIESDDLKIAVLELVNACIDKQPGLTEAFFKVTYDEDKRSQFFIKRSKESENMCDGILDYMEDYLEAVANDPSKTTNDQLKRIMSLFHALWKNNMQSLVKDLLKKPNFWSSLCSPLLTGPIANYQYSQLFNILGIELFKMSEDNNGMENFKKVIEKFLVMETFKKWLKTVFDLSAMDFDDSVSNDDTPEWLSRLQSFKDFVVLLLKKKSIIQMPSESNKLLMDECMKALVQSTKEIESGADSRPFVVLSELYLILLNDQTSKYTNSPNEDIALLKQVESLLNITTNCYNELHHRAKESVLAITIKIQDLQSDVIQKNSSITSSFIRYNVEMLCMEIFNLESQLKVGESEIEKNYTIILTINMLKKMLLIHDDDESSTRHWDYWFNQHKIFNRLMSIISLMCQLHSKRHITAELLDLVVLFAKGSYSKELVYCDIGDYLWMKFTPPKELANQSYMEVMSSTGWKPQDWWIIYTKGIQLVKLLLERHNHLFIKDALFFVGIHEEYLTECILLAKQSLEPNAMKLIRMTLGLISEVLTFENAWRMDYFQSIMNLMKCIQSLLNHSVSLLHRPKILKGLTEPSKNRIEEYPDTILSDPCEELVNSMNTLIEIVTLCCKCLLQFSPKLLNLLCDVEFHQSKWISFIEVQFGAPKINADAFPQLSYGTVLSAVGIFVKVLNLQHHTFKQVPLNQLPSEDDQGSETILMASMSETAHQKALASPSSPRRAFNKSLSMSSVSGSVVQASNELLSHLDVKICLAALEFLLTLLASQSLLALKDRHLSSREKQLIRRELSTELYCLHDFVKKRILKDSSKSALFRQKFGIYHIINEVDDEEEPQGGISKLSQRKSLDLKNSMRVNVIRKLYQQKKSTPFEIPSTFSPIPSHSQQKDIEETPNQGISKPTASTSVKRVGFDLSSTPGKKVSLIEDDDDDDEPYVVNRADPSFTGLSIVKMVEEDYLHLMSNLFMFICQTE